MKIKPYCTQAMLKALTNLQSRGSNVPEPLREVLKARGWIDKDGYLTAKGIANLNDRGYS